MALQSGILAWVKFVQLFCFVFLFVCARHMKITSSVRCGRYSLSQKHLKHGYLGCTISQMTEPETTEYIYNYL